VLRITTLVLAVSLSGSGSDSDSGSEKKKIEERLINIYVSKKIPIFKECILPVYEISSFSFRHDGDSSK